MRKTVEKQIQRVKSYLISGALKGDIIAGIVTGSVVVPQSLSYALVANLPAEVGLYATISLLVYAILGSSPQLSVAPVATSSLLVGMATLPYKGTQHAVDIALAMACMAGIIQIVLGVTRVGKSLTPWLSRTMLTGYTTGVALTIEISQLSNAFGVKSQGSAYPIYQLILFFKELPKTKPIAVAFFFISTTILVTMQKVIKPRIDKKYRFMADATTMIVVVVATSISYGLHQTHADIALPLIGKLPTGFKTPSAPPLGQLDSTAAGTAVALAFMGFFEGFAVAKALPSTQGLSSTRESIAVGCANIVSSFFNGYSVAGGLSRTMVNVNSGATSQVSSILAFLVTIIAIAFLGPAMSYIPLALLASIIFVSVLGMIKYQTMIETFRISKLEFFVSFSTMCVILAVGPIYGLIYGMVVSVLMSLRQLAIPHIAELGEMRGGLLRNIKRYPEEAKRIPNIVLIRLDAPVFFANSELFFDRCKMLIQERESPKQKDEENTREVIRALIVDASGVGWIDVTALHDMLKFQNYLASKKIRFIMAEVRGPVRDAINKFNLWTKNKVAPFYEKAPCPSPEMIGQSTGNSPMLGSASRVVVEDELTCYSVHLLEDALHEAQIRAYSLSPQLNAIRSIPMPALALA